MLAPVPTITINLTNKTMNTISSVFIQSTNQHRPFHNARRPLRSSDARRSWPYCGSASCEALSSWNARSRRLFLSLDGLAFIDQSVFVLPMLRYFTNQLVLFVELWQPIHRVVRYTLEGVAASLVVE